MVAAEARRRALLDWYQTDGRDLPWRQDPEPWSILVSEIMSQQTQIARVIPAWRAFLDRYPTPGDLADSDRAELIRLWGGLGYQRRAFNLQRAARDIDRHGWPTDVEGLMSLPGVGPYTSAAVACFAFGASVPAVDTNLRRILSRWHGHALQARELDEVASAEMDTIDASAWNQAMMDLGASICRPRDPRCAGCPVEQWCDDPSIYQPPARQSRYEGSVRQARSAIVRELARSSPVTESELAIAVGLESSTVAAAIVALVSEQIVEYHRNEVRLVSGV